MAAIKCKNCSNVKEDLEGNTYCFEEMFDSAEDDWFHDEQDVINYLNEDRYCSNYIKKENK